MQINQNQTRRQHVISLLEICHKKYGLKHRVTLGDLFVLWDEHCFQFIRKLINVSIDDQLIHDLLLQQESLKLQMTESPSDQSYQSHICCCARLYLIQEILALVKIQESQCYC